ncbi:MAG: pyridoxamine 5'-phosphate oxidase family protein [Gemmatimonadetes bacterium]|nr:pyridoxamine 5'-phosphate oxidase family protein [Gemmatimonadota bacterium]MBT8477590.1 pyridoxamine 5'-phosphate oxidase family protein [Gemmatimonadota bacterium]
MNETKAHGEGGREALAREALTLIAGSPRGVLCTLLPGGGEPYASLVEILPLPDGDVVMFLSGLAEHRKNLDADSRGSLLLGPAIGSPDALTQPRATIVGRAERVEDRAEFRDLYLEAHPGSATYIDFPDFAFYRLRAERVRYIAGFGRMGWIPRDAFASLDSA